MIITITITVTVTIAITSLIMIANNSESKIWEICPEMQFNEMHALYDKHYKKVTNSHNSVK